MQSMDTAFPPLVGQFVDIRYQRDEDRLHLTIRNAQDGCAIWLTRRLCGAFLNGLADVMARTSDVTAGAVSQVRDDILLFEYAEAVAQRSQPQGTGEGSSGPQQATVAVNDAVLMQRVDLSAMGGNIKLSLFDKSGCRAVLTLSRDNAFQLAEALFDQTVVADWALAGFGWLDRCRHITVPCSATVN